MPVDGSAVVTFLCPNSFLPSFLPSRYDAARNLRPQAQTRKRGVAVFRAGPHRQAESRHQLRGRRLASTAGPGSNAAHSASPPPPYSKGDSSSRSAH